jgi:hypothetical protein
MTPTKSPAATSNRYDTMREKAVDAICDILPLIIDNRPCYTISGLVVSIIMGKVR